ncbi:hypothetical protein R2R35_17180 [Anaerocolumna sp. AGMB13020]|uniref:hypothetical protein n=1 Tax=Anaerocolumna sp. AGMB13020 TaxID=3081750 RepID=UPI0029537505|nr:hypothetical protein [Anaerocolumna sp. AGMB13020]WOO35518.1 hypothetical protein R2R35_17180 [Anaerocolumna sp. AGMB13020]
MKLKKFIILLSLALFTGCSRENIKSNTDYENLTIRKDILFDTNNDDFIFIKGEDINSDGSNAYMEFDMGKNDGTREMFRIRADVKSGTEIMYFNDKAAVNLLHAFKNNPLENINAFEEGTLPKKDYYFQVSFFDLDEDGQKEIILSIGNMIDEEVSIIFQTTDSVDTPAKYIGAAYGEQSMYLAADHHIYAPYGREEQINDYIYLNKKLYKAVN